jgi:lipoate synthase
MYPSAVTKSGLMVGLGETDEEILEVMRDMRKHNIDMLRCAATCDQQAHNAGVEGA